jgi:hypothetical protein
MEQVAGLHAAVLRPASQLTDDFPRLFEAFRVVLERCSLLRITSVKLISVSAPPTRSQPVPPWVLREDVPGAAVERDVIINRDLRAPPSATESLPQLNGLRIPRPKLPPGRDGNVTRPLCGCSTRTCAEAEQCRGGAQTPGLLPILKPRRKAAGVSDAHSSRSSSMVVGSYFDSLGGRCRRAASMSPGAF